MHALSKRAVAGLVVATAIMPLFAFADTSDLQSQIQSLLSQIKALQEQIRTLIASSSGAGTGDGWKIGSTTPPSWKDTSNNVPPGQIGKMTCVTIARNLRVGSHGEDVKNLQQILSQDSESGFQGSATGFFGPLTAQAVMKFQKRMGIASSTDGSVGTLTRGFFERQCGAMPSIISGTITASGGSTITIQNKENKSVIVNITASTTIKIFSGTSTPPTTGTTSDLVVGKTAVADGPKNADGSIQAVHIAVGMVPMPPMSGPGDLGTPPRGMMPTINGPLGGNGDNHGGPQNW